MIKAPAGWKQHFGANLLTLYAPVGGGRVRYYERLRPSRTFSQVVTYVLDRDPEFRVTSIHQPTDLVTTEGEYGAWVRVNGRREGSPATRFVGAVFTDEFAAALDTLVLVPDKLPFFEHATQELLLGASFGLGLRRRRFLYDAPPGWQAIPTGLVANWYPRDFPRNHANLVVMPAEPVTSDPAAELEALLVSELAQGSSVEAAIVQREVSTYGGLAGRHWAYALRRPDHKLVHREVACFVAAPYTYMLRLESLDSPRLEANRDVFLATARSMTPFATSARRGLGTPTEHHAFSHWD